MRLQLLSLVPRAGPYLSCGPGNEAGLYLSQVWERDWAKSLSGLGTRLGHISLLGLGTIESGPYLSLGPGNEAGPYL